MRASIWVLRFRAACGNALVAANTGAAAEHLTKSGAGVLLQTRTPEALADAILQISKMNLAELKQNAEAYATKFSWKNCFEKQFSLYQKLVQG